MRPDLIWVYFQLSDKGLKPARPVLMLEGVGQRSCSCCKDQDERWGAGEQCRDDEVQGSNVPSQAGRRGMAARYCLLKPVVKLL